MKKRLVNVFLTVLLLAGMVVATGCSTHIHVVGNGGNDGNMVEARQWYVLWGLIPINNVDSAALARGASDYTIKTEQSPLDVIINIVTGPLTVYSRTVTVTQ